MFVYGIIESNVLTRGSQMDIFAWKNTSRTWKAQIIGKLLGDGCITKQQARKPRFQFIHMESDFGWSQYCYHNLKFGIPLNPPRYKKSIDNRLIKGYSTSYYVQSRTSDVISFLYTQWYPMGKKVVPFPLLKQFFNRESLAWWYMDDGHLKIIRGIPQKVILSTESFTSIEINKLILFLKSKYNLIFSIDKQKRMILYDQYQIYYFLNLVNPFMHRSMFRKITPYSSLIQTIAPARTTIYLPKKVHIIHPTKEINYTLGSLANTTSIFRKGIFYEKYQRIINNILKNEQRNAYQIIISEKNLANLKFLKENTGLTYSQLTYLCFIKNDYVGEYNLC